MEIVVITAFAVSSMIGNADQGPIDTARLAAVLLRTVTSFVVARTQTDEGHHRLYRSSTGADSLLSD